jgi:xylulokinase
VSAGANPGAVLGLDVGTTAVKGIALGAGGEVLARATASYPLHTPRPGWTEQDPEDWWVAAEQVLGQLEAEVGRPRGIGLSGQMHGLVALDAAERPVRPAILWNDQRTTEETAQIESALGLEEVIALTGNRPLTGFTAPKLLWIRRHEPAHYDQIASVMLPKDYIRLRLCGEHATDVSDASGTLLFDVGARGWSTEMCRALEVPLEWLPAAAESPTVTGTTSSGVPVAAGAGDQAAGALGVGVDHPGPASIVLGTSGVVFTALERFAPDPEGRTHTFCHSVPGTWHAMGVMLSAAGSLEWLHQAVAAGEGFGELLAGAAGVPAGAEGLIFLPYLAGERTPHFDPLARGSLVGLTLRHDRAMIVRAVLEGVAFGLRDCLDVLRDTGVAVSHGLATGGGARSDLWLRIVASALGIPISRTRVDEGAAFGAALLGGVAGGVWRDTHEAANAAVAVTETFEPEGAWSSVYAEHLERFRALYPAIREATDSAKPIWEETAQ